MSTDKKFYIVIYTLIVLVLLLDISLFIDYKNISKTSSKDIPIVINQSSVIRVYFQNYSFEVPEEYKYKVDEDIFYISSEDFSLNFQFANKKYDDIISMENNIKNNFENYGYIVSDVFKIQNTYKYLIYSIQDDDVNHFVIYTNLNQKDTFVIEVVDKYDDIDNIINKIDPILSSIKYSKQ